MRYLLSSLVQIALLRKDPSVLPASLVLLVLLGAASTAATALQSWILHGNDHLVGRTAVDLGLALVICWLLLAATNHGHRFRQTMSAVFGTSVVVTPFAVVMLLFQASGASSYLFKLFAWAGSVIITIWSILIIAHILRSAIQIGFVTSLAIPLTWLVGGNALLNWLFPPVSA